jgi:hypothetical protein
MSDYNYLPVSNGSGDASLMHLTGNRGIGSTVYAVDSVVNVPANFIGTCGTLLATGFIDPTTKTDFKGHVSGATLVIDAFEPGSTDTGNTSGQVVVIKPNTGWANRVAQFIKNATNFGTPEAVTFAGVTAGATTVTTLTSTNDTNVGGNLVMTGAVHSASSSVATVDGSANVTPNKQIFTVTGLDASATVQAPTIGTWDGAAVVIRIKDNGVSRSLTFVAAYTNISGLALPSATSAGKWHVFGVMYNSNVSKWQIMSISTEA